jgi:hypothetical protein
MEKTETLTIRTSEKEWFQQLAGAYRAKAMVVVVDDANLGINPESDTLLKMGRRAGLSAHEWVAVLISLGMAAAGAWLLVMAVLDPEPYSKVMAAILGGLAMLGLGGFSSIRILTKQKPPNVKLVPGGFEISWN